MRHTDAQAVYCHAEVYKVDNPPPLRALSLSTRILLFPFLPFPPHRFCCVFERGDHHEEKFVEGIDPMRARALVCASDENRGQHLIELFLFPLHVLTARRR